MTDEPSEKSSGTWPVLGTMSNGVYYERPMLERPTAGNGSSSWPTARANEAKGGEYQYDQGDHNKPRLTLTGEAQNWHTPRTTPRSHNAYGEINWATPTSRDYKDGSNPSENVPTNALLGRQAPRTPMPGPQSSETDQTSHRRLNPKFVEWLMGWPMDWVELTNSESSATE